MSQSPLKSAGITPTHAPPLGRPSNSLGPVWANMYSDPFSTTSFFLFGWRRPFNHWTKRMVSTWSTTYATTQLALQLHQKLTQVVCRNREARKRPAESNGTPAMDFEHMNVVLKWCMCMLVLNLGIGMTSFVSPDFFWIRTALKAGLGFVKKNVRILSQWNPIYKAFH